MNNMKNFTAAVGFDGYIDRIARVIKNSETDSHTFHTDIGQFSELIHSMAGKSGDMEIVTIETRPGGNAPIIAGALTFLGANTVLIGTTKHEVFNKMSPDIRHISYGMPGDTLALEFDDGKLMLADITDMRAAVISVLNDNKLLDEIVSAYTAVDLCVLTNWASMPEMHNLWEVVLSEIRKRKDNPKILFDLADFTKRSTGDVVKLIELIKSVSGFQAYLGLNDKEALLLTEKLGHKKTCVEEASDFIFTTAGCAVITHTIGYCVYAGPSGQLTVKGEVAKHPIISTGAGDHFNAAFANAVMHGIDLTEAMELANKFSYSYVTGTLYK